MFNSKNISELETDKAFTFLRFKYMYDEKVSQSKNVDTHCEKIRKQKLS